MENVRDLMRFHEALAWRPGVHEPEKLEVVVAYSGNRTAVIQAGERRAVVGGEWTRDVPAVAATIRTMLRAYPVRATVNGEEVEKCPCPGQPDIHQVEDFARPGEAGRPQLQRAAQGGVYPHVIVDGLTYGIHPATHRVGLVISMPDPTDTHQMYQRAISYIITASPELRMSPQDDASIETCEPDDQGGVRITPDQHMGEEIDRRIRAQWNDAMETIGSDGTVGDALALPTSHLWPSFREVFPREGVTPTVVRVPEKKGPDNNALAETLRMHLEENPELGMLPARPRMTHPPHATTGPYDRQDAEPAVLTLEALAYTNETQRDDGRADAIKATVSITDPDGAKRPVALDLQYTLDGTARDPKVTLAAAYRGDGMDLAAKMLRAYCGMTLEAHDAETQRESEREERRRMTALAHGIVEGAAAGYLRELQEHWEGFEPVNPRPDDLDVAAEIARIIRENDAHD